MKMKGDRGGGMAKTKFLVVCHCKFIFREFQKRHRVTDVNNCQLDDTNG